MIPVAPVRHGDEWAQGSRFYPFDAGRLVMIRISSLAVTLAPSLIVPAFGQETKPSQAPSQNAQSKDACRAKREAQYNENKDCQEGGSNAQSLRIIQSVLERL